MHSGIQTFIIIFLLVATIAASALAVIFYLNPRRKGNGPKAPKESADNEEHQDTTGQLLVHSAALASAANGIIITDTRGIIQWVNPAFSRLTGYSAEESVGHNLKMLNSGVHDAEYFRNLWTTIMSGEVWHNEIVNRRKDGELYTEEMTITPVLDKSGNIIRFVAIKQDISARKKLEQMVLLEKERMGSELDVARKIQMSMLPKGLDRSSGRQDITITAQLIPAREVGGDFYDFYWIDDENFCFFVGDVSGKGVPAALHMAVSKTLLKAASNQEKSTARILTSVNSELSRDNDNYMFVTVFIGILNTTTGYLTYSSAGHNPPFMIRNNDRQLTKLGDLHGLVLGAMEGFEYKETVLKVERGTTILVYTDGVTESMNLRRELFSEERLVNILEATENINLNIITASVIDQIRIHERGADQADDITLMAICFDHQNEASLLDYLFTSLPGKMDHIPKLTAEFENFALKHQVPSDTIQKINIVFDELLSNTIKYGYTDNLEHEIEVKIRFYKDKLTITILDDGNPFNPFDQTIPDTTLSIPDREIGGLGVHMVKFLVDDYHYEYQKQLKKNSIHITKHISN